ncbi:hypothetical protein TNCV_1349131 [Trichonephila clavipes]|nr:hypothetical protein TNCV_1349131 [Trichonephila clavipes]
MCCAMIRDETERSVTAMRTICLSSWNKFSWESTGDTPLHPTFSRPSSPTENVLRSNTEVAATLRSQAPSVRVTTSDSLESAAKNLLFRNSEHVKLLFTVPTMQNDEEKNNRGGTEARGTPNSGYLTPSPEDNPNFLVYKKVSS